MFKKILKYYGGIGLGVIVTVGVILRFSKILCLRDFWYDEAFTGIITRMSWPEMQSMIFRDVHPPLYYWLLKSWASFVGYSGVSLRLFSLFIGLLSIVSVYYVGKKIFNKKVGLLSAFIMAISPFAIQYSQEARMYSLFAFITIWLVYFFIKALQTDMLVYWLAWGFVGGLFFYTHYLSLFFFPIFYLVAVWYKFSELKKEQDIFQEIFRSFSINYKFWLGVGIIAIFFITWLPALKQHLSREGLGWVPVAYFGDLPRTMQVFFYGHQPGKILQAIPNEFKQLPFSLSKEASGKLFANNSLGLFVLAVILGGLVNIFSHKTFVKNIKDRKNKKVFIILTSLSFGVLFFLIFLSQLGKHFYVDRYFMPVAVIIYLLLAAIVSGWKKTWQLVFVAGYILTLLWLKPIPYDSSWVQVWSDTSLVNSQTIVIADNAFEYATARFHFGEGRVKMYNRGEPNQDFSLWIIVKPEDQITKLDNYLQQKNVIYVGAGDCHWNEYNLKPTKKVGRLQVCKN